MIKNNAMGWTHSNPSECVTLYFQSEVEAVEYCQSHGWTFDISYPHFRYHQKKSYTTNYAWKGYPKDTVEEF